jgi:hypothetical protein
MRMAHGVSPFHHHPIPRWHLRQPRVKVFPLICQEVLRLGVHVQQSLLQVPSHFRPGAGDVG